MAIYERSNTLLCACHHVLQVYTWELDDGAPALPCSRIACSWAVVHFAGRQRAFEKCPIFWEAQVYMQCQRVCLLLCDCKLQVAVRSHKPCICFCWKLALYTIRTRMNNSMSTEHHQTSGLQKNQSSATQEVVRYDTRKRVRCSWMAKKRICVECTKRRDSKASTSI